jgi:hypothetical protein
MMFPKSNQSSMIRCPESIQIDDSGTPGCFISVDAAHWRRVHSRKSHHLIPPEEEEESRDFLFTVRAVSIDAKPQIGFSLEVEKSVHNNGNNFEIGIVSTKRESVAWRHNRTTQDNQSFRQSQKGRDCISQLVQ